MIYLCVAIVEHEFGWVVTLKCEEPQAVFANVITANRADFEMGEKYSIVFKKVSNEILNNNCDTPNSIQ